MMQGTNFVVGARSGDCYLWRTFVTEDENRIRRFWLQRTGIDTMVAITEADYWDLEQLCGSFNVTFLGVVKK